MINIHKDYLALKKNVLNAIVAEFFIQLISTSLLYILPLYMRSEGYTDAQIAGHISFRFLGVLLTTLPFGFFIKGRKLKGFFMATGLLIPTLTITCIVAVAHHMAWLVSCTQFMYGVFYAFTSAAILPFIVRNEKSSGQTEAIALHFAVWSLGAVISGCMVGVLTLLNHNLFNVKNVLILIGAIGFANLYFLFNIKEEYVPEVKSRIATLHKEFDWKIIGYVLIPSILIGIGAGLAIPFIGLFFANVHGMATGSFALVTSFTSVLVVGATLYIPTLKRRFGMRWAIANIQVTAIMALVVLASTQYISMYGFAVVVAVCAYCVRNPLMNMIGPLTSELSMNYVGENNQEILSALMSAISSGGYFVSAILFKKLREQDVSYASIFYITAGFYFIAAFFYYSMSGRYLRRQAA